MKFYMIILVFVLLFISACATQEPLSESQRSKSLYQDFNQVGYEQALNEGKTIYLEFYANWCPICKQQEPVIQEAFTELDNEAIVGFRVNYNDNQVTEEEENLARQYGIAYQHTKVIINKEGKVAKKSNEFWSKERIIEELNHIMSIKQNVFIQDK